MHKDHPEIRETTHASNVVSKDTSLATALKGSDTVMIHPNFSHPFLSPLRPHLLQYMHQHQHQPHNQFQPSQ